MPFPVDVSRILAAEAELGRRLPVALRQRLLRDNGGEIAVDGGIWWLHPVWDPTNRRTIGRTANHIVKETESARERSGFPSDAVAIASNGTGDLLIVRAKSEAVEWWDPESGDAGEVDVDWR